jgi:hypothetical protein
LDYVVRPDIAVKPEAEDPAENDETVDQEMTARAPHTVWSFVDDMRKVWDIMSNICGKHSCFVCIKPPLGTRNGRDAYMLLFDHFLGPKNVGNMTSDAEIKLTSTLYNGEKKRFTWETYVRIHTEQHSVLNGLRYYWYAGIDDSSKVRHLLKGIKTIELDVCKMQVMASPSLCDNFAATVELYSTFIKQMKAENPQLNVSEVVLHVGKRARILMESVIPLEFQMFQTLQWMTGSLRSMNTILSPLTRRTRQGSSASSVAMLERFTLELATTMARTTGKEQQSSPSPVP